MGGWGVGRTFWLVSLSSVRPDNAPSNLLPDIPWKKKKPFSVEVNGPAQINSSVWVSLDVNKVPESPLGAFIWGSRTPTCPPHVTLQSPSALISLLLAAPELHSSEHRNRLSGKPITRAKAPFTQNASGGPVQCPKLPVQTPLLSPEVPAVWAHF